MHVRAISEPGRQVSNPMDQAYSVKKVTFFDAMKFAGPAPEIINGRLAMIGIVLAAAQEAETGQTALYQMTHGTWQGYMLVAVLVYASLVPILKAVKNEAFGIFSPRAETANARAAMLGFGILMALEWKTGVPFF